MNIMCAGVRCGAVRCGAVQASSSTVVGVGVEQERMTEEKRRAPGRLKLWTVFSD